MKRATILLLGLLHGCSTSHEVLSTPDGGRDGTTPMGDASSECGPPPPDAPCVPFVTDRGGQSCCRDEAVDLECRDGSWQCPAGHELRSECSFVTNGSCDEFFCRPMDARSTATGPECPMRDYGYAWDGRACRPVGLGCNFGPCEGADCSNLYGNLASCLDVEAYGPCSMGCEAMDVRIDRLDPEACDDTGQVGWYWNGWACERFVGCNAASLGCEGTECARLYDSEPACEAARASCIASCDAVDATVTACSEAGPGALWYAWDGFQCREYRSCAASPECIGSECDQVFDSSEACSASYSTCVGPAPVRASLTCGLDEEALIDAALRLAACDVTPAHDTIGGYFQLQLALPIDNPSPGYVPPCEVVECAAAASSCVELDTCLVALRGAPCDASPLDTCVGTEIHACDRSVDRRVPIGDCATLGGTCALEPIDGDRFIARCDTPGNPGPVTGASYCDGDQLIVDAGGESVRLTCAEHIAGTVCREVRFAGEFPGAACGHPSPSCSEFLTTGLACDGDQAVVCVGGVEQRIDCTARGYARCENRLGCVD